MRSLAREIFVPTLVLAGVIAGALVFLGWGSLSQTRALERDADAVREALALAVAISDAEDDEVRWMSSLNTPPAPGHEARIAEADERVKGLSREIEAYALAPRAAEVWEQFMQTRTAMRQIGGEVIATARLHDHDGMLVARERWHLMAERADRLLGNFTAFHLNRLDRTVAELQRRRGRALAFAATAIVSALLLSIVFAVLLVRTVVRPLVAMAKAARRIEATGEASPVAGADRPDELGVLAHAFNAMTERLTSVNTTLARANESLGEADRRKNQFLAVLSHELRNPLAPVKNGIWILDRVPPGSDQARRAREVIGRQVDHLAHLVDDLLDVTRITRGKIQLQRRRLELNELVRRTIEDHRAVFEDAGVTVLLEAAPTMVFVDGDPHRIAQVIGNLLQNAAKFTPDGGQVTVSVAVSPSTREGVLRVADTGSGMAPDVVARLFEPFMQADTTLDRSQGGLGLGLALVKGFVEQHGGSVEARSVGVGRGSEFTVRLPLDVGEPGERQRERVDGAGARRRVLVIEDVVDAADTLRAMLELAGHEVVVAYDGASGLARARELHPEFVLCDIGLPGMSGYEVARAIRADESLKDVHLVALTGYALPDDLQRAAEAGFERHLAKPASLEALEAILGGPRATAQQTTHA